MKTQLYSRITQVAGGETQDILDILQDIKTGKFQDLSLTISKEKDIKKRNELKVKCPYWTPCGTFKTRKNDGLIESSGLICVDIDQTPEEKKENLKTVQGNDIKELETSLSQDPFVFSCFRSISNRALAILIKINSERFKDSFEGLRSYFLEKYCLDIDKACKDISRPRLISYDPNLYLNEKSKKFTKYLKKEDKKTFAKRNNFSAYFHSQDRFKNLISKIDKNILPTNSYHEWLNLGFAIASEYGESGYYDFYHLSSFSGKFQEEICKKQYDNCCRGKGGGVSIGTFYYYAKEAGFALTSERENTIIKKAFYSRTRGETTPKNINSSLSVEGQDMMTEEEETLAQQVISSSYSLPEDKDRNITQELQEWLKDSFDIKRNEITLDYELKGELIDEPVLNHIVVKSKLALGKDVTKSAVQEIIFNKDTPTYNPVKQVIESVKWDKIDRIHQLTRSIVSNTGTQEFRVKMINRWLLGIIQSVYSKNPNPLCLVLAGKQNTGKTEFFRRLLPVQLRDYLASNKLDAGKDSEILMCKKILIYDDEYSGKSKKDAKLMKDFLSKDEFTFRAPYASCATTQKRYATLGGTCNEIEILNDPTGNRRIIVFEIINDFLFEVANSVDRLQLFAQLKHKWDSGETATLTKEEIAELNSYTDEKYSEVSLEAEQINRFFILPEQTKEIQFMTNTDIKDFIEKNSAGRTAINQKKLGMELKKLGYLRVKSPKRKIWGYQIKEKYSEIKENLI